MTLAILLFGLVIATCFIAYIADNIGKNMGKKRVSLFGLRPRQTATLISMASSVLIMLATVGILMATSQSLSNALLRYDIEKTKANRERTKLLGQNQELLSNLESQRGLIKTQDTEIAQNRRRAAEFSKQRASAEKQLQTANARLQKARMGEDKARAQTKQAQAQLVSARRQFQTFQSQLKAAKAQVAAAKSRVENAQAQVQKAQQQLQEQQRQVTATNTNLKTAQDQLQARQKDLLAAKTDLRDAEKQEQIAVRQSQVAQKNLQDVQQSVNRTMAQLSKAENKRAELETQRDQLDKELAEQRDKLAELTRQARELQLVAGRIAAGDIAVPLGEVFAERTVVANLSTAQVNQALRALMKVGREQLADPPRTINLVVPEEAEKLSEDEFLNGFAAYLSTLDVSVSVRLLAARNHARGETKIDAYLLPIIIRTIYEKEEVLRTATIAAGSDASVFNQLLKLLNDAEQRAREDGVTPLPTRENPLFYPTGTNELVFEALHQIQSEGGTVNVSLIAAEDISSIDSPRVRFKIKPQTSP